MALFRRQALSDGMDLDLKDAVIGLDLGSSSTRAIIRTLDGKSTYIHVEDKDNVLGDASTLAVSDFSSTGYPFEAVPGPVYYPHPELEPEVVEGRRPMSLKYGMYLLANASTNLTKEYPAVEHVCELRDDIEFRARARRGLVELLAKVLQRVHDICQHLYLRITRVGLTVPVQWTLDFEDVYADIIIDAFRMHADTKGGAHFAIDKQDIYFVTETEALAAYMFDSELDQLRPAEGRIENKWDYFLFFDFGGHNMNGCGMFVKRSGTQDQSEENNEKIGFFTCFESFGNGGGSEHWEFLMGERCTSELLDMTGHGKPDNKAWTDIMHLLNHKKRGMGPPNRSVRTAVPIFVEEKFQTIFLEAEDINTDWRQAFEGALDVVNEKLAAFRRAVPSGADCTVVMSGGSAANRALQSYLADAVAQNNLPPPIFTSGFDILYGSARIAKGAAFAIANLRTVEQFFGDGAAIGIQKRPGGFSNNMSNPSLAWETSSSPVLVKNTTREVFVDSDGTDDFKLICDPFFARFQRPGPKQQIDNDGCYDLVYLGDKARGKWRIRVSIEVVDKVDMLVIKTSHCGVTGARPAVTWTRYRTLRLPLHFVAGTNTVIVGERGKTLGESLRAFGVSGRLPKNPDGSDGREDEDSDDQVMGNGPGVPHQDDEDVDSDVADAFQPSDEEEDDDDEDQEVVIPRATRSRPRASRRVPRAYGRFVTVPLSTVEKKRKRMMAYEDEDEEEK